MLKIQLVFAVYPLSEVNTLASTVTQVCVDLGN